MPSLNDVIIGSWLIFFVVWLVSAANVKKGLNPDHWWQGRLLRLIRLGTVVALTALYPKFPGHIFTTYHIRADYGTVRLAGLVLTITGLSFAVWARIYIGRNWSFQPAVKEDHELVTSGPYGLVRHPIYAGMLAALLASLIGSEDSCFLYAFIVLGITFLYRVRKEEELMLQTFPDVYPEYRSKTKALIPFVW